MPGVLRPTTFVDVLSTIYNQNSAGSMGNAGQALTVPLSAIAEADETATAADAAFAASQTNVAWDQGVWSAGSWS